MFAPLRRAGGDGRARSLSRLGRVPSDLVTRTTGGDGRPAQPPTPRARETQPLLSPDLSLTLVNISLPRTRAASRRRLRRASQLGSSVAWLARQLGSLAAWLARLVRRQLGSSAARRLWWRLAAPSDVGAMSEPWLAPRALPCGRSAERSETAIIFCHRHRRRAAASVSPQPPYRHTITRRHTPPPRFTSIPSYYCCIPPPATISTAPPSAATATVAARRPPPTAHRPPPTAHRPPTARPPPPATVAVIRGCIPAHAAPQRDAGELESLLIWPGVAGSRRALRSTPVLPAVWALTRRSYCVSVHGVYF